jgi:hypothetical protein
MSFKKLNEYPLQFSDVFNDYKIINKKNNTYEVKNKITLQSRIIRLLPSNPSSEREIRICLKLSSFSYFPTVFNVTSIRHQDQLFYVIIEDLFDGTSFTDSEIHLWTMKQKKNFIIDLISVFFQTKHLNFSHNNLIPGNILIKNNQIRIINFKHANMKGVKKTMIRPTDNIQTISFLSLFIGIPNAYLLHDKISNWVDGGYDIFQINIYSSLFLLSFEDKHLTHQIENVSILWTTLQNAFKSQKSTQKSNLEIVKRTLLQLPFFGIYHENTQLMEKHLRDIQHKFDTIFRTVPENDQFEFEISFKCNKGIFPLLSMEQSGSVEFLSDSELIITSSKNGVTLSVIPENSLILVLPTENLNLFLNQIHFDLKTVSFELDLFSEETHNKNEIISLIPSPLDLLTFLMKSGSLKQTCVNSISIHSMIGKISSSYKTDIMNMLSFKNVTINQKIIQNIK